MLREAARVRHTPASGTWRGRSMQHALHCKGIAGDPHEHHLVTHNHGAGADARGRV